jgi:hypothetical protein
MVECACHPKLCWKQEAEIRRLAVQGQPGQKHLRDTISMEKSWVRWYMPVNPVTVESVK